MDKSKSLMQENKIKIRAFFFASLKDLIKKDKLDMSIQEGSTLKDLLDKLFENMEERKSNKFKESLLCAINHNFASLETKLKDGDEVAFMPFVSGG